MWKFSRLTRRHEHAVLYKSRLRRSGIKVTSITEPLDDSPPGKVMESIIESLDEFYAENMAQDIRRGMREAASRGFWLHSRAPYGYRKVRVKDGTKKRIRLELDPPADSVVRRMFRLAESGVSPSTSPRLSTRKASPLRAIGAGEGHRSGESSATRPTRARSFGDPTPRTGPVRCESRVRSRRSCPASGSSEWRTC